MTRGGDVSKSDNRRRIERFSMSIPSKVRSIMHDHFDQTLATTNISAGGVFLETGQAYPVGTSVTLNISLDFGSRKQGMFQSRFQVEGTVIRSECNGMAIAFDPEKVTAIRVNSAAKAGQAGPVMIGIVGEDPLLNDLLAARLSQETGANCSHSSSLPKILEAARPDLTLRPRRQFDDQSRGNQSPSAGFQDDRRSVIDGSHQVHARSAGRLIGRQRQVAAMVEAHKTHA